MDSFENPLKSNCLLRCPITIISVCGNIAEGKRVTSGLSSSKKGMN